MALSYLHPASGHAYGGAGQIDEFELYKLINFCYGSLLSASCICTSAHSISLNVQLYNKFYIVTPWDPEGSTKSYDYGRVNSLGNNVASANIIIG